MIELMVLRKLGSMTLWEKSKDFQKNYKKHFFFHYLQLDLLVWRIFIKNDT